MDPHRFRELRQLFEHALDLTGEQQRVHLDQIATTDPGLAQAVESLLREEEGVVSGAVQRAMETFLTLPPTISVGDRVGRYEVVRRLAVGGMAEVWAVRHVGLGTMHALKVLFDASDVMTSRLLREGGTRSRLRHPNIVPVDDLLFVDDVPALLMPLVDGPTLGALLRGGRLPRADAAALFLGVVDGVVAIHAAGMVHRERPERGEPDRRCAGGRRRPRASAGSRHRSLRPPRCRSAHAVVLREVLADACLEL